MYIGQRFGSYRLLRLIGEGGFAQVYLGEHIHLQTQAAIKVLTTTLTKEEIAQFRNEARLMMNMNHPHIIRVLDFGIQGAVPFLVMSYAPGGSLRGKYPRGSRLPFGEVVFSVNQIASALQYIHDRKLIHRDVKPENLLITQDGSIALSDFGIAVVAHSERSLSQEDIGGTGVYMAPELFEGKPRTASDQYALGIVAYEWLTGTPPFRGSITQLAHQHALTPPRPLREQVTVSSQVEAVILRALAKDPRARFPTVKHFALALEEAMDEDVKDRPSDRRCCSSLSKPSSLPGIARPGPIPSLSVSGTPLHNTHFSSRRPFRKLKPSRTNRVGWSLAPAFQQGRERHLTCPHWFLFFPCHGQDKNSA